MALTIAELHRKVLALVGVSYNHPKTANKGATGLLLETITGIPHSSNALDCVDGELKTCPVRKNKKGHFTSKESIAITMMSKDALMANEFETSKCFKKMESMLIVPYLREGDSIQYLTPTRLSATTHPSLYQQFKNDYTAIRNHYIHYNILMSMIGHYLQTRTKGTGHGSTSRAFYLRQKFIRDHILISL